jgi:poly(A) polymerase
MLVDAADLSEKPTPMELLAPAVELARTGVQPSAEKFKWIRKFADEVVRATPHELYSELTLIICGRYSREGLQLLRDTGLLIHILPEIDATVAFSQEAGRKHKDVWEHTKTVVWQAVPRVTVRWAALLHDIGKVPTREILPDGRVTFHGHAEVGRRMFRRTVVKRIAFPPDVRRRVEALILHHLRAGQYEESWTDSAVRRFAKDMGDELEELLLLSRADVTSKRVGKRKACLRLITALSRRIADIQAQDDAPRPLPPGLGHALMSHFGWPPGPHVGELRRRLEAAHASGELQGDREFDYYVAQIQAMNLAADITVVDPRQRHQKASVSPPESNMARSGDPEG